jgi:hypothetical protein
MRLSAFNVVKSFAADCNSHHDILDGHRGIILSLDVVSALNGNGKKVTGPGSDELYAASASRDKTARV